MTISGDENRSLRKLPRYRKSRLLFRSSVALRTPQTPAQLSASVRPGGRLTEAKHWTADYSGGRGRPAPPQSMRRSLNSATLSLMALIRAFNEGHATGKADGTAGGLSI